MANKKIIIQKPRDLGSTVFRMSTKKGLGVHPPYAYTRTKNRPQQMGTIFVNLPPNWEELHLSEDSPAEERLDLCCPLQKGDLVILTKLFTDIAWERVAIIDYNRFAMRQPGPDGATLSYYNLYQLLNHFKLKYQWFGKADGPMMYLGSEHIPLTADPRPKFQKLALEKLMWSPEWGPYSKNPKPIHHFLHEGKRWFVVEPYNGPIEAVFTSVTEL